MSLAAAWGPGARWFLANVSGVFGRRAFFVPQEFQGNETREGVVSDRRTVFIILQSQQKQ